MNSITSSNGSCIRLGAVFYLLNTNIHEPSDIFVYLLASIRWRAFGYIVGPCVCVFNWLVGRKFVHIAYYSCIEPNKPMNKATSSVAIPQTSLHGTHENGRDWWKCVRQHIRTRITQKLGIANDIHMEQTTAEKTNDRRKIIKLHDALYYNTRNIKKNAAAKLININLYLFRLMIGAWWSDVWFANRFNKLHTN